MYIQNLGQTLRKIIKNKKTTAQKVSHNILSPSQMSNILNNKNMPSWDALTMILANLNTTTEEFIHLLDNDYLKEKTSLRQEISVQGNLRNIDKLREIAKKADSLYIEHEDPFFLHVKQASLAIAKLFETNNDYQAAREYLTPVKDYLHSVKAYGDYEIYLVTLLLFMFQPDEVIHYVNKAENMFNKNRAFYKSAATKTALYINAAVYFLDYPDYHLLAEKYAGQAVVFSSADNNATDTIHAKIIHQVVLFKLANGTYDPDYLKELMDTFSFIGFHSEYERCFAFVESHGITL